MNVASHILRQPQLAIFARQPVAGQAKTRLQPEYTPARAAEIAACLIRATAELAVSYWPGDVCLYGTPDAEHPLFRELARDLGIQLAAQRGADLGERMRNALCDGLKRRNAAAVIGCDVPHCSGDILDQADHLLAQGRNVIGPTEDGGYYFIGLSRDYPGLFSDIPWGTPNVLERTLERGAVLGVEFDLLPSLTDIDTVADIWRVSRDFPLLRQFLR